MSSKQIPRPTESELAILKVLWEKGPATVRQVNEAMNEARDAKAPAIKYTTTLKLMQIMYQEKQLLRRDETQRTHVYEAMVKEQDMQLKLLDRFVESTFRGSAMKMVMQALGNHEASKAELDEIKALIKKIENKK